MAVLKVALLQTTACGNDQSANLAKGEAFCREASRMEADIALFPEMWNIGYPPFGPDEDDCEFDLWKAPELWNATNVISPADWQPARTHWQAQSYRSGRRIYPTFPKTCPRIKYGDCPDLPGRNAGKVRPCY